MIFAGKPPIGAFDVVRRSIAGDAENLIIILIFHGFTRPSPQGRGDGGTKEMLTFDLDGAR